MGDCVIITMFHKFSFSYHEREIDSETMKSEKLGNLSNCLPIFYHIIKELFLPVNWWMSCGILMMSIIQLEH